VFNYHIRLSGQACCTLFSSATMSSNSTNEKGSLLPNQRHPKKSKHVLVIHGGAGVILRERSSPEQQARYHAGLRAALQAGNAVLSSGGEAMDAVVTAVSVMEGNLSNINAYRQRLRPVLYFFQTIQSSTLARAPYLTRPASCVCILFSF